LTAIAWFGQVTPSENYTDIRVGYNASELFVRLTIFDRRLWYDPNPTVDELTSWDAATLYLDQSANGSAAPDADAYRFIAQMNWWESPRTRWQAAYRGNGSGWTISSVPFMTESTYRGDGGINQDRDNRGWILTFHLPFTSVGLAGPPSQGTVWRLGIVVHDRDDASGTPLSPKRWPEDLAENRPTTWGQLHFGLRSYIAPPATPRATVTIQNGLGGAVVADGEVGGGTVCGDGLDYWTQWGAKNYAGQTQVNVQNQTDVADWPCFSKVYITFPLTSLPAGKVIISATLTLYQFGNAGQDYTPGPQPSLIQVLSVGEGWSGATLTWNNAPLAVENVSQAWVNPLSELPPWPGLARIWDVSMAVAESYAASRPLRLALYSADSAMHSGKYFYSSHADAPARPTLRVLWGDP
jgi:hypothetical protein